MMLDTQILDTHDAGAQAHLQTICPETHDAAASCVPSHAYTTYD